MASSNDSTVGKEISSHCGKCKKATDHVITSMVTSQRIGKCQCKVCKAVHNYKDPEDALNPKPRKAWKPTEKKSDLTPAMQWQQAVDAATAAPKPYAMEAFFAAGDLIEHTTFGRGIVESDMGGNKIQVLFESGAKTLAHNKVNILQAPEGEAV